MSYIPQSIEAKQDIVCTKKLVPALCCSRYMQFDVAGYDRVQDPVVSTVRKRVIEEDSGVRRRREGSQDVPEGIQDIEIVSL